VSRCALVLWACAIFWSDVFSLGQTIPGRLAVFQEIRQEICMTGSRMTLTLQRRLYEERVLDDGSVVQDEIAPWRVENFGSIWVPIDPGWEFNAERNGFNQKPDPSAPTHADPPGDDTR